MDSLARTTPSAVVIAPELVGAAQDFAAASKSPNTRRAYSRQWAAFTAWCSAQGFEPLPAQPNAVALYAAAMAQAGRAVASIEQAVAAIGAAHSTAGHASPRSNPAVKAVMSGIRRTKGVAQREAAPVLAETLRSMLEVLPPTLAGRRDAALLLVGFAGAFRRSELVGLELRDVAFTTAGLEVNLRRSKTDQEGRGRLVALPYSSSPEVCPVRALRAWLDSAGVLEGPVFREVTTHGQVGAVALTGRSLSRIVKRTAGKAGLDPKAFSGHSLRAGFVTQAKLRRKDEASIMRQTGHKSVAMVRRYDRRADLWRDNAAAGLLD